MPVALNLSFTRILQWHYRIFCLRMFFLLLPMTCLAQNNPLILSDTLSDRYLALQNFPWRFHPGHNAEWASPSLIDSSWPTTAILFGQQNIPLQWNGSGWFRIWIKKPANVSINTWGFYLNHDGASETYFDGRKIARLGEFKNPGSIQAERNPFLTIPLAITDTLPHLLAIRYANYHPPFKDFAGFQGWISDLQYMNAKQKSDQRFFDYLLMSASAMAILVLLHLLLFAFYPKQKVNLFYSLFVLGTTISLGTRYASIITHDPSAQELYYKLFSTSLSLMPFLFALLLYQVSGIRMPRTKLLIIGVIAMVFIGFYFLGQNVDLLMVNSTISNLNNLFTVLVMADGLISVFKAIRRGNKRLWLIGAGILVVVTGSVIVGANTFRLFTFTQLMTVMAILCMVMPVLFSIYIALDIASTNRKLAMQLQQNKLLSEENLAKEQEKNKLITEQAEQLEKTVFERTAQVREQAERLREMDAAKSRFFVNLTHEFKTPLTLIINPAKELLKQTDPDAAKQYAQFILQNSERLLELINQLLDLSRLENGQMEIRYQNIDLINWLQVHVQQFDSFAEQNNISLKFSNCINSLPLKADTDKLEKIVQNLVSNAIKFSNPNGIVEVLFDQQEDDHYEITVRDNGIGIPAQKLPYIFDRFYQGDGSDTRTREGTGIGLALVKELVELLGGKIRVSSTENIGTAFTVRLPYLPALSVEEPVTLANDQPANTLPSDKTTDRSAIHSDTILVVEDNEQLRRFMEISLRDEYHVLLAKDGGEGILIATDHIPNLIITDLMMPRKNGYELCDVLKKDERTSHIPIIMLTAKTDQDSRIQGIETGADAYLHKPFDKRELHAQIANLIQTRKQLREKYTRGNSWLSGKAELPSMEQAFLNRVTEVINAHLDDVQFSAEELARQVGLGRTQLHRKLKGIIDQSPGELIRTIRMQVAHELLEKNTATVAEVSYSVGYGNPSNFSTSFTKHFGYPPSEAGR